MNDNSDLSLVDWALIKSRLIAISDAESVVQNHLMHLFLPLLDISTVVHYQDAKYFVVCIKELFLYDTQYTHKFFLTRVNSANLAQVYSFVTFSFSIIFINLCNLPIQLYAANANDKPIIVIDKDVKFTISPRSAYLSRRFGTLFDGIK